MPANLTAATDQKFLATLEAWIETQREILVMIRYSHAAGSSEFQFFSSFENLVDSIRALPPLTSIIAFRQPQLPLRGIVDDDFISQCLRFIPEGSEYLITETVRRVYGKKSWFHDSAGITHLELREDLDDYRGTPVAVGLYPPWLEDTADVISALVADKHGVVRSGTY